jgi:hypothetical protein
MIYKVRVGWEYDSEKDVIGYSAKALEGDPRDLPLEVSVALGHFTSAIGREVEKSKNSLTFEMRISF